MSNWIRYSVVYISGDNGVHTLKVKKYVYKYTVNMVRQQLVSNKLLKNKNSNYPSCTFRCIMYFYIMYFEIYKCTIICAIKNVIKQKFRNSLEHIGYYTTHFYRHNWPLLST